MEDNDLNETPCLLPQLTPLKQRFKLLQDTSEANVDDVFAPIKNKKKLLEDQLM